MKVQITGPGVVMALGDLFNSFFTICKEMH